MKKTPRKLSMQTDVATFRAALPLVATVINRFETARCNARGQFQPPTVQAITTVCSSVCIEYAQSDLVDIVCETVRQALDVLTGGAYELAPAEPGAHVLHDYSTDHPLHRRFEPCTVHTWGEDPRARVCFRCGDVEVADDE